MDSNSITKGFFWTFGSNLLTKLILLVSGIVIARLIGPAEMGLFFVVNTVFLVAEIFRDAGLSQTYIAEVGMDERKESGFQMVSVLMSALLGLLILSLAPFLSGRGGLHQMVGIALAALGTLSNGYGAISLAKLYREGRYREAGLCDAFGTAVGSGIALVLVFLGHGYEALVWQLVARAFFSTLLQLKWAPVGGLRWESDVIKHVFGSSYAVLASNGLNSIFLLVDQFLIVKMLGETAGGQYGVAKNLAGRPIDLLSTPMNRTMFPAYSRSNTDRKELATIFMRSIGATFLVILPIFAFMAIFARPIILFLFGKAYLPSIPVLQILAVYFGARSIGTLSGSLLIASGHVRQNLSAWIGGTLTTIAVLVMGRAHMSLNLFSWAFTAGAVVAYGLSFLFVIRLVPPRATDWERILKPTSVTVATSIFAVVLALAPLGPLPLLLVSVAGVLLFHASLSAWTMTRNATGFLSVNGLKEIGRRL